MGFNFVIILVHTALSAATPSANKAFHLLVIRLNNFRQSFNDLQWLITVENVCTGLKLKLGMDHSACPATSRANFVRLLYLKISVVIILILFAGVNTMHLQIFLKIYYEKK